MVVALKPNGACFLFAAVHRHVGEEATRQIRTSEGLTVTCKQEDSWDDRHSLHLWPHRRFSEAANTDGNVSVPNRDPPWLPSFPDLQETDQNTQASMLIVLHLQPLSNRILTWRSLLAMRLSCTTIPMCQSWTWNLYNLNWIIKYLYL